MTPLSVLTLVKNRSAHLDQLVEGLRRSAVPPAELVIVDMSDAPVLLPDAPFPVRIHRLETDALPLAAARNAAARLASSAHLLFLDVDCIPMRDCVGRMAAALDANDALLCADIRYLAAGDAEPGWRETDLIGRGIRHPVRTFPDHGIRTETNPGLFWSLAFAITQDRFTRLGGFDEAFSGYGAEDTDFGFRAAASSLPLLFVGGAVACHQHHASYDPPVQHFDDILRNARIFRDRWEWWPMEGWLTAYERLGLIERSDDGIRTLRRPTGEDLAAALVA